MVAEYASGVHVTMHAACYRPHAAACGIGYHVVASQLQASKRTDIYMHMHMTTTHNIPPHKQLV